MTIKCRNEVVVMETFAEFIDSHQPDYIGTHNGGNIKISLVLWSELDKSGLCFVNNNAEYFVRGEDEHTFVVKSITFKLPPNYQKLMITKFGYTPASSVLELRRFRRRIVRGT